MAEKTLGQTSSNLTDVGIGYILGLNNAGLSHQDIADKCSRSQSAVTRIMQRYDIKTFTGVKPPPGPQKAIEEQELRTIVQEVKKNRWSSLSDVINILPNKISTCTLQRWLSIVGIQKHIALKKPWLSPEHMNTRLEWAMVYKDWTVEDWNKVIFSDESKVEVGHNSRVVWVFRTDTEKHHADCLLPALKRN